MLPAPLHELVPSSNPCDWVETSRIRFSRRQSGYLANDDWVFWHHGVNPS